MKEMICQEAIRMAMVMVVMTTAAAAAAKVATPPDYGDALTKSILFFEGQRSGKLPPHQRMTWREDSALNDGLDKGVDLVGGYYDAGDNIKFNFPMAFSTTILAWSVLEFGKTMGSDLQHALEAIRWSTDYLLKATRVPGVVFVQVGDPFADHNCWERPEDMDTPRTSYAVTTKSPGSEVSAEIAAALAASSMVFKKNNPVYSKLLLQRALQVFEFADKYRGSYNDSTSGPWVCPFYCDFGGYQDELLWGAAWLHKATKESTYWNYVTKNINKMESNYNVGGFAEFGWDAKHAGINVLVSKLCMQDPFTPTSYYCSTHCYWECLMECLDSSGPFISLADKFVCSLLPESPSQSVTYSPGGLLFKSGMCNMQHTTALSFLLVVYARYMRHPYREIQCSNGVVATPFRLIHVARNQVDYILGKNPMKMSYMVGYGEKFPQRIHHRGSSLPSKNQQRQRIKCKDGTPYFQSKNPNPNLLTGAIVGGPDINDSFVDDRVDAAHLEPTTYVNAPLVGLLAYFKGH